MSSPSLPLAVSQRAFPAHPRIDRYFAAGSAEASRHRLTQCVLRGDGPALLLGAPGVGKTMLFEAIAADLAPKLRVVRLASTQLCTRRALLQAILHGLDGPYRNREEGELRLSLADLLKNPEATGNGVALLIDEAQSIPTRLLEELRVLTNVALDGVPRLRLVLAGAHSLDEAFTAPELDAFSQRIAARCYLEPLTREETGRYVRAHVAAAGGDPDQLLTGDAYESIVLASDGLPRLVNQVCDRAIVLATEQGRSVIDGAAINEAWSDLHQLAAPWQSPAASRLAAASPAAPVEAAEESSIEFGMLDDEAFDDALQTEAEAITASRPNVGRDLGASSGVWDAGDKLRDLTEHDELVDDEEELVSFAFPGSERTDEEAGLEAADLVENDATDDELASVDGLVDGLKEENHEAAGCGAGCGSGCGRDCHEDEFASVEDLVDEAEGLLNEATADMPSLKPLASADPFAEDFDEEEVVLDPFAGLERVIPNATSVVSSMANSISEAYSAIEMTTEDAPATFEANDELVLEDLDLEVELSAEGAPAAGEGFASTTEEAILIVEADETTTAEVSAVRREDYAQLFATLRQG